MTKSRLLIVDHNDPSETHYRPVKGVGLWFVGRTFADYSVLVIHTEQLVDGGYEYRVDNSEKVYFTHGSMDYIQRKVEGYFKKGDLL